MNCKFLNSIVATALLTGSALTLAIPTATARGPAPVWTDPHQLKPGQKGYGLTVFSGDRPERFGVEIISVLDNFLPHQGLILIKTRHPRLQAAKVVAGMSGSPIFIDGKMIGAYAYGWSFGSEAVAGVTPIGAMLEELARPIPKQWLAPIPSGNTENRRKAAWRPTSNVGRTNRFVGDPLKYSVEAHAKQVAASATFGSSERSALKPVSTPLMIGGLSDGSIAVLRKTLEPLGLEPLQAGGSSHPRSDTLNHFVDGGAIAVQLVAGDISASGIGTVTRVAGNRLLAFGHPMMNGGLSRLPTALAHIHWVLASQMRSFKIGTATTPLGSLINDRQAAIVVDSHVQAPMIPLKVAVSGVPGAPHPQWDLRVAHDRFMTPLFLAVAIGNAVDATTREMRDVSWDAMTTIEVEGHGKVTLHDFGVSAGGTPGVGFFLRSRAVGAVGALLNNPWQSVRIRGVRTKLDVRFAHDVLDLRGAEPLQSVVDAGHDALLRLHFTRYNGKPVSRTIRVRVPRRLAGSTVQIDLRPGYKDIPPVARPESVDDLMAALPMLSYPPDELVAQIKITGQGVAFRGNVATDLPASAVDTLRTRSSSVSPEPVPTYATTRIPIHHFVSGTTSVRIRVRPILR